MSAKGLISGLLLLFIELTFSGCIEENFIPDPTDSRLPKYTESGNQVAGALIDNEAWKTNFYIDYDGPGPNRSFYFTNYAKGDSITLNLDGYFTEGQFKGTLISFDIVIKNLTLNSLRDTKEKLNGQTFNLDGLDNYVNLRQLCYGTCFEATGGIGVLQIKTVKNYNCTNPNADGYQYCTAIIAGTFSFEFPTEAIKVESGRFDFQINENYIDQK